ncbi:hypothetical protein [Paenisporosarcina sp. OV554]|uniref:hypothetical protein n=1 Tax=Paenisporosarcina sp. OV554 TaxID=2135694 RepID=UPI000D3CFECA|nr:hypothetical protein [Paenisporosarcina sp. OV554]PUB10009.1 hypothetical protein C8K15_12233 [Paenisporosarcina sp. OV554]
MPRENENQHVEATPHFDGEIEGIINDPTASAGSKIGIVNTKGEFAQEKNPFNFIPKQDPEMKQFAKLMAGKKIED